jgi:hypothetical protein
MDIVNNAVSPHIHKNHDQLGIVHISDKVDNQKLNLAYDEGTENAYYHINAENNLSNYFYIQSEFPQNVFAQEKYRIKFNVAKANYSNDNNQNELLIIVGDDEDANKRVTFTASGIKNYNSPDGDGGKQEFIFEINAKLNQDHANLYDNAAPFRFRFQPKGFTNVNNGLNQYRIYDFEFSKSIPEHKDFSLICGIIILVTIISRRHPNRMLAVKHAYSVKN